MKLLATAAAAVLAAACGGEGKPASPEKVAVEWLQAKADYDGGKEWDLEAPGYRATEDRKQAVEEAKREKARECPKPDASDCVFPKGVMFKATGQRQEARCLRVFVRDEGPGGKRNEGAVVLIRVDGTWRVRDWLSVMPQAELKLDAARDCGVS